MKKQFEGIDFRFLTFLILLTQGNLFLKPLAFIFIFLFSRKVPLKINTQSFGFFYFLMLVYSLFSVRTLFWNYNESYVVVFLIGVGFWLLALISFQYLNHLVHKNNLKRLDSTIQAYFYINTLVCGWQLVQLVLEYGGNPYLNMSSGDYVRGFFANSSVNMIVNSFFIVYFFTRKNYLLTFVSFLLCLSTTYMSGLVILFVSLGYFVFTSSRLRLVHRFSLILLSVVVFLIFTLASPDNVRYAKDILGTISKENKPRKVVSFIQTGEYLLSGPGAFLFGEGMGNFSSRLAFICDGEYVAWFPRRFLYRSYEFTTNHYSLWNANVIFDRTQRGTSNQPFSVYNQMLGEYGVIGFAILCLYYFGFFLRNASKLAFGRVLIVMMLGFFFLDYWYEYFSVTVIFELMALYDLKRWTGLSSDAAKT